MFVFFLRVLQLDWHFSDVCGRVGVCVPFAVLCVIVCTVRKSANEEVRKLDYFLANWGCQNVLQKTRSDVSR